MVVYFNLVIFVQQNKRDMKKLLKFGNQTVEIIQDTDSENPRNWDNLGTCLFFGKHSHLGDEHDIDAEDYISFDEMKKDLIKNRGVAVIIPVYMYSHSGITIKTTPFGDRWDSGQLGFIVAYKAQLRDEYNVKRISKKLIDKVSLYLTGEIETLDQYINGEVYGFNHTDESGEDIDSCYGFYGDSAENGIFDQIDIAGLTFEDYKKEFDSAEWSENECMA